MKAKSVLLLAVALGCGLVAMLGVRQALSGNRGSGDGDEAQVLVAIAEVTPGTPLSDTNVRFRTWPREAIPEGAVTKVEEYEDRALKVRTYPGEFIMKAKLGAQGEFGAASDIPKGMRMISVAVDPTMTNSGMIWPGSHVDVFVTYKSVDRRIATEVATVLENVEVVAIDNNRDLAEQESAELKVKNISLLVTPEEAMRLKRAEDLGKIHLAMRGQDDSSAMKTALRFDQINAPFGGPDQEPDQTANVSLLDFLDSQSDEADAAKPEISQPEKATWKIRIFAGGEERIEEVELPEPPTDDPGAPVSAVITGEPAETNPLLGYLKRVLKTP